MNILTVRINDDKKYSLERQRDVTIKASGIYGKVNVLRKKDSTIREDAIYTGVTVIKGPPKHYNLVKYAMKEFHKITIPVDKGRLILKPLTADYLPMALAKKLGAALRTGSGYEDMALVRLIINKFQYERGLEDAMFLAENNFDIFGLIEKGLAVNYYQNPAFYKLNGLNW